MAVENFVRENPDSPKQGQILWEADFIDSPYFQQYLRDPMASGMELMMNEMFDSGFGGFMGGGCMWQNDDHYMHRGSWDRDYMCSLYINWTLNTHAILRTETRQGYGCELKLDDKIYFQFNKYEIDPKSYDLLNDAAFALNEGGNQAVTIEIGGHTDSKGSNRYNQKLSQQRVEAVRSYLVNKGVDPSRMTAVGYGEEMPIDTNRTAEGRANNRRVEFIRTDNECKK